MSKELIRNGGFERGNLDFWEIDIFGVVTIQTDEVKYGTYAVKLVGTTLNQYRLLNRDFISVSIADVYHVGCWIKGGEAAESQYLRVYTYDADMNGIDQIEIASQVTAADWAYLGGVVSIPEGISYIRVLLLGKSTEEATLYADSFSCQQYDLSEDGYLGHLMADVVNQTSKATYYLTQYFSALWKHAEYTLYCSALTGTLQTLDVTIQGLDEKTSVWKDVLVFQQLDAPGTEIKTVLSGLGWKQRVKYVLGGTTVTDCDFKVGVVYKR